MVDFFFFKQKTAYEMRISDWSSDVCSSDLLSDDEKVAAQRIYGDILRVGAAERQGRELGELYARIVEADAADRLLLVIRDEKALLARGRVAPIGHAGRLLGEPGQAEALQEATLGVEREHVGFAEERTLVHLRVDEKEPAARWVVGQPCGVRATEGGGVVEQHLVTGGNGTRATRVEDLKLRSRDRELRAVDLQDRKSTRLNSSH